MEVRNPILRVIGSVAGEYFLVTEYLAAPCCVLRAYVLVRTKCIGLKFVFTVQMTLFTVALLQYGGF